MLLKIEFPPYKTGDEDNEWYEFENRTTLIVTVVAAEALEDSISYLVDPSGLNNFFNNYAKHKWETFTLVSIETATGNNGKGVFYFESSGEPGLNLIIENIQEVDQFPSPSLYY